MRTLTLNDGTVYELDWCHADKGIFNINIVTDASFMEVASKFGNHELTNHIVTQYGPDSEPTEYDGYTELQSIQLDSWQTGTVLIMLFSKARAEAA